MKRKLSLLAALFALLAPVVLAAELPNKPITNAFRAENLPFAGPNFLEISNMDWVDYYVVVHMNQFRIEFRTSERGRRGRHGFWLPSGSKVTISSPLHVWQLEGDNGRHLFVGIHENRTTPVRLVGFSEGDRIGMAAVVYDGGKDNGELLIHTDYRQQHQVPPPPAPTPYYDPYPQQYGGDGYPVPVIGQDPPPYQNNPPHRIPVIGQDPPPYMVESGPQRPPHRIPVIGQDPPPYMVESGPQNPPRRYGPPVVMYR